MQTAQRKTSRGMICSCSLCLLFSRFGVDCLATILSPTNVNMRLNFDPSYHFFYSWGFTWFNFKIRCVIYLEQCWFYSQAAAGRVRPLTGESVCHWVTISPKPPKIWFSWVQGVTKTWAVPSVWVGVKLGNEGLNDRDSSFLAKAWPLQDLSPNYGLIYK